ncbi:MAG: phage portal protein [Clostridium sp.]
MAKKKSKKKTRAEPVKSSDTNKQVAFCSLQDWDSILCSGYKSLSENPEVISAVNKIADLISSMTIHLMENTENGDIRIQDEFSRIVDINPNPFMTRKTFISAVVRNLLLEGNGNSVVLPFTEKGYLKNLFPIPASQVSLIPEGFGYYLNIYGQRFEPSDVIHIVINPGSNFPWKGNGYRASLKSIVNNLAQATATTKGFMESKWKPSIIVKVDGMIEEFSSSEGRKKLLNRYIESSEAGEPWLIPADQFEVETVKPLSLQDLAIKDSVELDKKTVAAILDVPPFILGVGNFDADTWNNFINTRIKNICTAIEQAFTKTLLISPKRYFRFNNRSLFSYDIEKLSRVGDDNYTRGIMTGNEVRDWIGLPPREGLDELIILENYIPRGMIGDQSKLQGGE